MTKTTAFSELTTATHEWLAEHPGATSVHLTPSKAALPSALSAWEQANAAALPDDLRDFYLLNDGLLMRWDVVAHGREVVPLGCLNVNSVQQLTPVPDRALRNERDELRHELPSSAATSNVRAFELDNTCEAGRVLLLIGFEHGSRGRAQVWFQDGSCALSLLATSFSEYFRLLVLHLGMPRWQYAYTEAGLDPTCRQWLRLMAPDRLATSSGKQQQHAESGGRGSCGVGAAAILGSGWGGGAHAPPGSRDAQPVRTAWVDSGPPTHAEALKLLSLSTLLQQQCATSHSVSRPSSAAGAPRSAVALLSGGGGNGVAARSFSRDSSRASTASSASTVQAAAARSSPHGVHAGSGAAAARPTGARPLCGTGADGRRRVSSASRASRTARANRAAEDSGQPADE